MATRRRERDGREWREGEGGGCTPPMDWAIATHHTCPMRNFIVYCMFTLLCALGTTGAPCRKRRYAHARRLRRASAENSNAHLTKRPGTIGEKLLCARTASPRGTRCTTHGVHLGDCNSSHMSSKKHSIVLPINVIVCIGCHRGQGHRIAEKVAMRTHGVCTPPSERVNAQRAYAHARPRAGARADAHI